MPDLGRDFLVAIYSTRPSFDPAAGEMMALVSVEAGADQVLVDRERDRCRVERTPAARDLDKWCSPAGLVLAARRGAWGLSIVEDHYLGDVAGLPTLERSGRPRWEWPRPPREPVPSFGRHPRARVPEDVCSCLRCRDLVLARRPRGGYLPALAAPGRLYRRIYSLMPWQSACQGPGAAGVEHGRDCAAFRMESAGAIRRARTARARGLMLAQLIRRLMTDPVGCALVKGGAR